MEELEFCGQRFTGDGFFEFEEEVVEVEAVVGCEFLALLVDSYDFVEFFANAYLFVALFGGLLLLLLGGLLGCLFGRLIFLFFGRLELFSDFVAAFFVFGDIEEDLVVAGFASDYVLGQGVVPVMAGDEFSEVDSAFAQDADESFDVGECLDEFLEFIAGDFTFF